MDSKINLEHALGQFKNYISAYDENDPKINLKITHTYRVMEICGILAKGMDLPEEKRKLAELIENGKIYDSNEGREWMCLNCGHIYRGTSVPAQCPVCLHGKGYFIPAGLAPYLAECCMN